MFLIVRCQGGKVELFHKKIIFLRLFESRKRTPLQGKELLEPLIRSEPLWGIGIHTVKTRKQWNSPLNILESFGRKETKENIEGSKANYES